MAGTWWTRPVRPLAARGRLSRPGARPALLELEDRVTPATFSDNGTSLSLVLTASETLGLRSNGASYTFSLAGSTWAGANTANVTGSGGNTLTVTATGITAFTNAIFVTDSGAGNSVAFTDSGASNYNNNLSITLDSGSLGVTFAGRTDLVGKSLAVATDGPLSVGAGARVAGGFVTLQSDAIAIDTSGTPGAVASIADTSLLTFTPGTAVALGGADAPGTLGLTAAELQQVSARSVTVGGPLPTNITLVDDLNISTAPTGYDLVLFANGGLVSQVQDKVVTVPTLTLLAGDVQLNNFSTLTGGHQVRFVSGVATQGDVRFTNALPGFFDTLTVNNQVRAAAGVGSGGTVSLIERGGQILISAPVTADADATVVAASYVSVNANVAAGNNLALEAQSGSLFLQNQATATATNGTATLQAGTVNPSGNVFIGFLSQVTGKGDVTIRAYDAAFAGQDIVVDALGTVASSAGTVTLQAGDNVTMTTFDPTFYPATATAGQKVVILADQDAVDPDPGVGAVVNLTGAVLQAGAGKTIDVGGGADADTFIVGGFSGGVASGYGSPMNVLGGAPATFPADRLFLELQVTSPSVTFAYQGGASATLGAGQPIGYAEIEGVTLEGQDPNTFVPVTVTGTNAADVLTLARNGAALQYVFNAAPVVVLPFPAISFAFQGLTGNDALRVLLVDATDASANPAAVNPVPDFGLSYDGGGGTDSLVVVGTYFEGVPGTDTPAAAFQPDGTTLGTGQVFLSPSPLPVSYTNIDDGLGGPGTVELANFSLVTTTYPNAADTLAVGPGVSADPAQPANTPAVAVTDAAATKQYDTLVVRQAGYLSVDTSAGATAGTAETVTLNALDTTAGANVDDLVVATGVIAGAPPHQVVLNGNVLTGGSIAVRAQNVVLAQPGISLQSTNSSVTLDGLVDGAAALTLTALAPTLGLVTLTRDVGATTPLLSLATTAGTGTAFSGNLVATTGKQTYSSAVTVAADITFNAGADITFAQSLTGAGGVTVQNPTTAAFNGVVNVRRFATDAAGATTLNGGVVITALDQVYADAVSSAAGSLTLSAGTGIAQPSGSLTTSSLALLGAGTFDLNQFANDVDTFGVQIGTGTVRLADADEVTVNPAVGLVTANGDVVIRTTTGFTAGDTGANLGKLGVQLGTGSLVVRPGDNPANPQPAAVVFLLDAVAAGVYLGAPGGNNNLADTFLVRPASGAPVFVFGNLPAVPLAPGQVGDALTLAADGAVQTSFQLSGSDGTIAFSNRAALAFASIETPPPAPPEPPVPPTPPMPPVGPIPQPQPDSFTVVAGSPLRGNVLANDVGSGLTAVLAAAPPASEGSVVLNPDGSFVFTPAAGFVGTTGFAYQAVAGTVASSPVTVSITVAPRTTVYAVGAGAGAAPLVEVYSTDGSRRFAFPAFEDTFLGGVRVAVGDVTGDGVDDIVVGAGPGGGPRVAVIDGATGARVLDTFVYEPTFLGGVFVAAGDVDGDGVAELIVSPGSTGGPRVRVFRLGGEVLSDFFAYEPSFLGGVRVAAGDLDGDRIAEVVTTPGPTGAPRVRVFNGATGADVLSFFAFSPQYIGGTFVAVVGATPGRAGQLIVGPDSAPKFDGSFLQVVGDVLSGPGSVNEGTVVSRPFAYRFAFPDGPAGERVALDPFLAYDPAFLEGVRVAGSRDATDGYDFITAPGVGGQGLLRFWRTAADGQAVLVREQAVLSGPAFPASTYVGAPGGPPGQGANPAG